MNNDIRLLYIDLFCGAGGTSTGVEMARLDSSKCAKVIACVNHDPNAIASHLANHPGAVHFTEDIRTLNLTDLVTHVRNQRTVYTNAKTVLWASLECTNFSRAKGGLPRDADSRTLAEHLFRYIDELKPDYIQIENVEEFMSWGDLDENGKPMSKDAGRLYMMWVQKVCRRGYRFDYRILNAANYGAYTSRKRFFGIFAKADLPIAFPEPTHEKNPCTGMFGSLKAWRPVKDVLNLENEGASIFDRKKPLVDATLERIYAGLVKFVAGGRQAFLSKQFSGDPAGKNISLDQPAGAVTCKDHHALVTVRSEDKVCFIDMQYGNGTPTSVDVPAMTVTANPKHNLIVVKQDEPSEDSFLMNPQFGCEGASIDRPCFTLIAKMDKKPPYLVTTSETSRPSFIREENGMLVYEVYETDSAVMKKIKEFMARYGKTDIKMRMLDEVELKMIMGFPRDYVLIGTQADRKKFSGKAVYRPKGKAGEYARWAANLFVGCSNRCTYCYCKKGVMNHAMGQDEPRLKKCFRDGHDAIWTFRMELMCNKDAIIREGGIFFSFTTDPCLLKTWRTHFDCIVFALAAGVPVTILTKCVGWLDEPYTRVLWENKEFMKRLCVGFTLTGMDELEPEAASNDERIEAMERLHDKGVHTFASIEPVIDIERSLEMISRTKSICDLHKIGLLTGEKREYRSLEVTDFIRDVLFMSKDKNPIKKIYFKNSVLEAVGLTRESLMQTARQHDVDHVLTNSRFDIFKTINN